MYSNQRAEFHLIVCEDLNCCSNTSGWVQRKSADFCLALTTKGFQAETIRSSSWDVTALFSDRFSAIKCTEASFLREGKFLFFQFVLKHTERTDGASSVNMRRRMVDTAHPLCTHLNFPWNWGEFSGFFSFFSFQFKYLQSLQLLIHVATTSDAEDQKKKSPGIN